MAADVPTVYIVIPIHNRLEATRECLDSLRCQTYPHFRIVLIDDGSSDGTSHYVKEHYPEVTILQGNGNLWWTGATNLGVRYALKLCREDHYILTLNNDTVLPPGYLETITELARQVPKALIGSIARDYSRKEVCVDEGVTIDWLSAKYKTPHIAQTKSTPLYSVSALSGRGTLIPAKAFHHIGLYDAKNFPHYAADYDFSLRAAAAGYKLLLHPCCYLYSRTDLTGISNTHKQLNFSEWLKSFYSIKSPNNLKIRIRFGLRHSPLLCRPSFIIFDLLRVILGTLRNQVTRYKRGVT